MSVLLDDQRALLVVEREDHHCARVLEHKPSELLVWVARHGDHVAPHREGFRAVPDPLDLVHRPRLGPVREDTVPGPVTFSPITDGMDLLDGRAPVRWRGKGSHDRDGSVTLNTRIGGPDGRRTKPPARRGAGAEQAAPRRPL